MGASRRGERTKIYPFCYGVVFYCSSLLLLTTSRSTGGRMVYVGVAETRRAKIRALNEWEMHHP